MPRTGALGVEGERALLKKGIISSVVTKDQPCCTGYTQHKIKSSRDSHLSEIYFLKRGREGPGGEGRRL